MKTMQTNNHLTPVAKPARWIGWILTALPALLLIFSAVIKLLKPAAVVEGFLKLGIQEGSIVPLGIVELAAAILYLIPRTSMLGAILLTGYLGGAILATLRVGEAFLPAIMLGVMIWGGLYLREPRLRQLLPLRRGPLP